MGGDGDVSGLREQIADLAAEGVPYVHRGTSRSGCDCTGLVIGIFRELGFLTRFELPEYPVDWNLHAGACDRILEYLDRGFDRVTPSRSAAGDIAVMFFGRCPAHVGILVAADMMVHCFRDAGSVRFARMIASPWSARWRYTYRVNEEKLRAMDS
jgi:cell wall-associated NlpC family hydrolase